MRGYVLHIQLYHQYHNIPTMSHRSSLLISDYILRRAASMDVQPLTPFNVIKMTVIAHGRHLAITNEPLIVDRIEAWKHGPVIPVLYHELKIYGDGPVPTLRYCGTRVTEAARDEFFDGLLTNEEQRIIDGVVYDYGHWTMGQLYELCHASGSPWDTCYTGERGVEIPDSVIRQYYLAELI